MEGRKAGGSPFAICREGIKEGTPPLFGEQKECLAPIIFRTKNTEKSHLGKIGKNFGKNLWENVSGEEKAPKKGRNAPKGGDKPTKPRARHKSPTTCPKWAHLRADKMRPPAPTYYNPSQIYFNFLPLWSPKIPTTHLGTPQIYSLLPLSALLC